MSFYLGRSTFPCCPNWCPCYILFLDGSDVEPKVPEDYARVEENDGIYFRTDAEKLVLDLIECGALCTEFQKEHDTVFLQTTLYSWKEIVVFHEASWRLSR